jgi:hypothetical protein
MIALYKTRKILAVASTITRQMPLIQLINNGSICTKNGKFLRDCSKLLYQYTKAYTCLANWLLCVYMTYLY